MKRESVGREAGERMRQKIGRILQRLRHLQMQSEEVRGLRTPVVYTEEANFRGTAYNVPLFILRTKPCFWFKAGGCSMCNYQLISAMGTEITEDDLLAQFDVVLSHVTGRKFPYILLTSSGSFLDDREVPEELRLRMLRRLSASGLKALSFECRAEFLLDRARLRRCAEAFAGGTLQAGIGLESANPFVRNVILHKGLDHRTIERAVEALQAEGMGYYFYVMVGKPFLLPAEDLADTVATIHRAFELGGTMIVLEMMNVQPYTLTHLLYHRGLYQPPSLWMGIEVLHRLSEEERVQVPIKGYEKAEPMPEVLPDGCNDCRDQVRTALRHWNLRRDWQSLETLVTPCGCRTALRGELERQPPEEPLDKRMELTIDALLDSDSGDGHARSWPLEV